MIRRRAETTPERTALTDLDGGLLTFAGLHTESLRWAGALRRVGVGAGDRVATLLPTGLPMAALWTALGWCGAVDVSLNTAYRGDMLRYVLADSGARIVIIEADFVPAFAQVADVTDLELVVVAGGESDIESLSGVAVAATSLTRFLDGAQPLEGAPAPKVSDVQGVVYTSGTTGPSKGVVVHWGRHQEGVRMFLDWMTPEDRWFSMFPACHNSAKIWMRVVPFIGCSAVLAPTFRTRTFWSQVTESEASTVLLLPNMLHWLLSAPADANSQSHTLREVLGYGPDLAAFGRRFGVPVHVNYGNTEGGNTLWHLDVRNTDNGYSGRAHPPFHARVVDEDDIEVPTGEVGELVVRNDEPWMMFSEYHGMPRETVRTLRNGWYHTGDAFRQDADGGLWFVDRRADYIRRRGENISSYEVEKFVLEHPQVLEAAAVGVPDPAGEDEVRVFIAVRGELADPRTLLDFLEPRMPRFMLPRYVDVLTELPKTEATKRVRKVELRARPVDERTWDREAQSPAPATVAR